MIDVTDETFEQDVLERSKQVAIVVDLWAPWCGPCRTLGPIIEKVVGATEGQVALVKVNVDENPRVAALMGVKPDVVISATFIIGARDPSRTTTSLSTCHRAPW